jgi:uncharacterized protein
MTFVIISLWRINMSKKILPALLLGCGSLAAHAGDYIAVDQNSCAKRINNYEPFMLILKTGEELHAGIKKCAQDAGLIGASIQGLGQFVDPVFAYYGPNAKPNIISKEGVYELISLNGNLAKSGEEFYTHIHAALGDKELVALAGHIKEAKIGATAELLIIPFTKPLVRDVNPETNFGPIVTSD